MTQPNSSHKRPNYGIDAPGVVRNLLIVGAVGITPMAGAMLGLWSLPLIRGH